jgi:hypothetical protein
MSMLAGLAVFPSIIICLAFVEFIFERAAIAQAYTVKTRLSDSEVSSAGNKNAV